MELSTLLGNQRLKQQLSAQAAGRGLAHAYILSGCAGSGKHTLARLLTAAMVCTAPPTLRPCHTCPQCRKAEGGIHPDVWVIAGAAGKAVTVDQVRALRADAHVRPNEGARKIYWLEGADRMNQSAQNALLKLLEEGPPYAAFLLLAENAGGVLETVRSRCEVLELSPLAPSDCADALTGRFPDRSREDILRAAQESEGVLGRAIALLEQPEADGLTQAALALADALEGADELTVLERALAMDKLDREGLRLFLQRLGSELTRRAARPGDRQRRLAAAAQQVGQLRAAAELNVGGAQLGPWLCAWVFRREEPWNTGKK